MVQYMGKILNNLGFEGKAFKSTMMTQPVRQKEVKMIHEKMSAEKIVAEHILVGLSSSPSNAKIVRTAAKMASAFGARFTALYVETSNAENMSDENKKRLENNRRLAEKLGAELATVYGEDVSYQIAEFARTSGVTKVVVGRSSVKRRHFWSKPTLTEKLTEIAPNLDIYIIPDFFMEKSYKMKQPVSVKGLLPRPKDLLLTLLILAAVTLIGVLLKHIGFSESHMEAFYILGVMITALFTRDVVCTVIGSVLSLALYGFFLAEPVLSFRTADPDFPLSIAIIFAASLVVGTIVAKLQEQARVSSQSAFQTKMLFDTDQMLQKAQDDNERINITAVQLMKLLNRDIIAYPEVDGTIQKGYIATVVPDADNPVFSSEKEQAAAEWALTYKKRAGATTETLSDAKCLYVGIRTNNRSYGVVGIDIDGKPLDTFEESVLMSVLGGCALAIENSRDAKEKELSAVLAKSEKLRGNLLRAISNDLQKPLISITEKTENTLTCYENLEEDTRRQVLQDISSDARWLLDHVENLQLVTQLEEGNMNFDMSYQLVDDVIKEAIGQIDTKNSEHKITAEFNDGLLFVNMDSKLIMRVIVNIVDNAVKFSPAGSEIKVTAAQNEDTISVSIADQGTGIPDSIKPHVFDMFFTGVNKTGEGRSSIGLGLSLCKSIIDAHGGEITLKDNEPHGSIFTFTLPLDDVSLSEPAQK